MPSFATQSRVGHSAAKMFDLVADVEAYPQFVPLCEALTVRSRVSEEERTVLIAAMTVGHRLLRESFTSRVLLDREAQTIRAEYLDGPFHHLDNLWRFEKITENESMVHFSIDYEFRSKTVAALMGTVFDGAFRKFIAAFEARADAIYGRPP